MDYSDKDELKKIQKQITKIKYKINEQKITYQEESVKLQAIHDSLMQTYQAEQNETREMIERYNERISYLESQIRNLEIGPSIPNSYSPKQFPKKNHYKTQFSQIEELEKEGMRLAAKTDKLLGRVNTTNPYEISELTTQFAKSSKQLKQAKSKKSTKSTSSNSNKVYTSPIHQSKSNPIVSTSKKNKFFEEEQSFPSSSHSGDEDKLEYSFEEEETLSIPSPISKTLPNESQNSNSKRSFKKDSPSSQTSKTSKHTKSVQENKTQVVQNPIKIIPYINQENDFDPINNSQQSINSPLATK